MRLKAGDIVVYFQEGTPVHSIHIKFVKRVRDVAIAGYWYKDWGKQPKWSSTFLLTLEKSARQKGARRVSKEQFTCLRGIYNETTR